MEGAKSIIFDSLHKTAMNNVKVMNDHNMITKRGSKIAQNGVTACETIFNLITEDIVEASSMALKEALYSKIEQEGGEIDPLSVLIYIDSLCAMRDFIASTRREVTKVVVSGGRGKGSIIGQALADILFTIFNLMFVAHKWKA